MTELVEVRAPLPFVSLLSLLACAALAPSRSAAEVEPTVADIENARRCAAETRVVGYAFQEVRDNVRAGGTTRAQALLSIAEDALQSARSACREDPEVTAHLELLAVEADGLRRSLEGAPR